MKRITLTLVASLFFSVTAFAQAGTYTNFGAGCKGSNNVVPALSNTAVPTIGKSFTISCSNIKAGAAVGLITGISNTKWGTGNLPGDLGLVGAPGCKLLVSMDSVFPLVANASGVASLVGNMPNITALIGVTFYQQCLVIDPLVNALGMSWSNGGIGKVGK